MDYTVLVFLDLLKHDNDIKKKLITNWYSWTGEIYQDPFTSTEWGSGETVTRIISTPNPINGDTPSNCSAVDKQMEDLEKNVPTVTKNISTVNMGEAATDPINGDTPSD